MDTRIHGLHHVTATVTDAQEDLDFWARLLGLRLVKKTVNFDNHGVYHFYYGDERGTPSTLMTTFPYKGWDVPVGTKGAGQITATSFSVPAAALDFWRLRLAASGFAYRDGVTGFGEETVEVDDPSTLRVRLVGTESDAREPWTVEGVGGDVAIRGLHGVLLTIRDPAGSIAFLKEALGFEVVNEAEGLTRLAVGDRMPGQLLEIAEAPDAPAAVNGLGTVHHVAFAISDGEAQLRIREKLLAMGRKVTEVRDRQYFTSIYFREPGGVLCEIATLGPGFTVDEPLDELGRNLRLPPWEEPHRPAIEAGLPPLSS